MYAIVATGGKQLKVAAGDVVVVEKLDALVGASVTFDVIFLADDDQIVVDSAELASATVTGEVVEQFKGEKAIIFKFKKRKGYKRLKGHRQNLTRVLITDILADAEEKPKPEPKSKPEPKPKAKAKAPAKKPVAKVAEPVKAVDADTAETAAPVEKKKVTSRAKKAKAPKETVAPAPAAEKE